MAARVSIGESFRFITDCLKSVGANPDPAKKQAEIMIQADITGHTAHGLSRLDDYVKEIQSGSCEPNNACTVIKETPSTALVNANNVMGATSSEFAMDIAIQKAKKTGVGWVTVQKANHNGVLGLWAKRAADAGLIGIACANSSPIMSPVRTNKKVLGFNPLAIMAPGTKGDYFCLDMSTTTVDIDKIENLHRQNEKMPIGWAVGPDGKGTTSTETALTTGMLCPLGGSEITAGYKGFGLAGMVEIFTGIASGPVYGHKIQPFNENKPAPANLGHCFIAVDPKNFALGFRERVTETLKYWRALTPLDPKWPVRAPGDKEKLMCAAMKKRGYLVYEKTQIEQAKKLAEKLHVKPMKSQTDELAF